MEIFQADSGCCCFVTPRPNFVFLLVFNGLDNDCKTNVFHVGSTVFCVDRGHGRTDEPHRGFIISPGWELAFGDNQSFVPILTVSWQLEANLLIQVGEYEQIIKESLQVFGHTAVIMCYS